MMLSEQDVQAARLTYEQIMQSMMNLDLTEFVELCTEDIIHITADGEVFQAQGRSSLYERVSELMAGIESFDMEYSIHTISGDGRCAYILTPNKGYF